MGAKRSALGWSDGIMPESVARRFPTGRTVGAWWAEGAVSFLVDAISHNNSFPHATFFFFPLSLPSTYSMCCGSVRDPNTAVSRLAPSQHRSTVSPALSRTYAQVRTMANGSALAEAHDVPVSCTMGALFPPRL